MRHFFPTQSLQAILDSFAAIGLDTKPISSAFFSRKDALPEDWGVMTSVDALKELWEQARLQTKTPHLFVRAGLAAPVGCFGIIDHLVFTAETLEAGLLQLQKYITLVGSTSVLEFCYKEDTVEVQMLNRPYFSVHDYVDQWLLGLFIQRFRTVLGVERAVATLKLRPLKAPDPTLDALLGAPVLPNPLYTAMEITNEVWKMPLPTADPALHNSLSKVAEELLFQRFSSAPLAFAVWNVLSNALSSGESISQAVAARLGISSRTLQRRLQKEKFSLSSLLESYRKQEAIKLISEGASSLAEIASQLGYNEQSSFNRSFKRWMGLSPRQWMKQAFTSSTTDFGSASL